MSDKIVYLSDDSFESDVLQADVPVLVDYWAEWCGPCKMMAPAFEQAAGQLEPRVRLAKLNTEESPEWAMRYGVRAIPTMVLFAGGEEIDRLVGVRPRTFIEEWLESCLVAA